MPHAITPERLRATLEIVHSDLRRRFAVPAPRIAVLGLNPHAGESGHLGREEIEVIEPVLEQLRAQGFDLRGPVPADTAFTPQFLAGGIDVVVAMYHDQGLPVIKHDGFGHTVNVTLGLPIIRTSVDHGTALSLARSGQRGYREPGRRGGARDRAGGHEPWWSVSVSVSTFCTIRRSSVASSMP